ncbi:radical SAM/SPASM domain-containing protein [Paenibacillus aceris]|uniref:Radical SAM protein with 4Fe4S-binding SPASM domain n=1 Tax=Paenibacillus aceris TaxID=869555 RepID=A0ABS4HRT0_9BACL|nr:radical SAM/SPASM domain-containing protein [Paenibacillus aceris]MBP1960981.1 radical SAM protein with 4Fe4S-binding SPASM domain [Paenibacillus aceris]NHW35354.1 radical SAM protein [Paenibacillus aceris]
MKKFKKFYIEITSVCNLACTFCPQTKRQANFIKIDTFTNILDQIKPHTDHIYLHVKGEPLLHPKIDELLDLSHEKGFKVNITTNGTLINKNRHKLLDKPALRQMNFSLHSFDGHEGSEDKEGYVMSILRFAKEIVAKSNVIISFRLWNLTMDNQTNQERQRNREVLTMLEKEFELDYKIDEEFVRGSGVKLAERVYLNQDHEFQWPDLKAQEIEGPGFCHALRNQAGILVDGTVIPCCLDGEGIINLGNINQTPFSEIVEGERANRLFEGFSRREVVEELCRKCGYRERFSM